MIATLPKQCVAEFVGTLTLIFAFGPSLVSGYRNNEVSCWARPLPGGAVAGFTYSRFVIKESISK
jgi:hypothetical protein